MKESLTYLNFTSIICQKAVLLNQGNCFEYQMIQGKWKHLLLKVFKYYDATANICHHLVSESWTQYEEEGTWSRTILLSLGPWTLAQGKEGIILIQWFSKLVSGPEVPASPGN